MPRFGLYTFETPRCWFQGWASDGAARWSERQTDALLMDLDEASTELELISDLTGVPRELMSGRVFA